MVDEDDVGYVDEIDIKIETKREEGERFEREEEDRCGGEQTGFAAVKEEKPVVVKEEPRTASNDDEEYGSLVMNDEESLLDVSPSVVALREGRDDDDGADPGP
ncbi:hypothetical protein TrLO_g6833 [Triparma laevis f. longispina]|uniref:Uncharacterized protein n=1 Tax=Triparma laevis f. longispina TaxID=1714387 RepID=A0A9W7KS16_9STRA|nr:hypothetical protein TrLO_g6833 [Triparma laevis f. longispina]